MILLVYANAGYGHKKAAEALLEEIKHRNPDKDCKAIDILDFTPKFFSVLYTGTYRFLATYLPWFWGACFHLYDQKILFPFLFLFRKWGNRSVLGRYVRYLEDVQPECLVFTHFIGIHTTCDLRSKGKISSSIMVSVTDFYAHSFWIDYAVDSYFVMDKRSKQAMGDKWKINSNQIHSFGIPIRTLFAERKEDEKDKLIQEYGFSKEKLTLLFSSGSFGYGPIKELLDSLNNCSEHIQAIVVCGNNKSAFMQLSTLSYSYPVKVLGFVNNMDELMEVSDVLVAKPGGITTSEALSKEIPMVISSYIPGQEEGNLKLLQEYDICWKLNKPSDVVGVIKEIEANPHVLAEKRKIIKALAKPNSSSDIVDHILNSVERAADSG